MQQVAQACTQTCVFRRSTQVGVPACATRRRDPRRMRDEHAGGHRVSPRRSERRRRTDSAADDRGDVFGSGIGELSPQGAIHRTVLIPSREMVR